ncbi:MAG: Tad domain-containing protein [Microthrixaceae bacterium]|nr:Tad domain-containing protein [Microthrixaceae bacterium]
MSHDLEPSAPTRRRRRHNDAARGPRARRVGRRGRDDRGYVMVISAMFVTAMLAVAALAVDLGGFYVEASRIQRASDAAALAGVVWLPNVPKATAEAKAVAAENGYTHGVNADVTVKRIGLYEMQVRIEADGELFFGKAFTDDVRLARAGEARYTLPVPLGSSTSAAGMGNYNFPDGRPRHNIWLSIHSPCSGSNNGDLLTNKYIQPNNRSCSATNAGGSTTNPDYDTEGYSFAVDVHAGAGAITVQGYDVGECTYRGGTRLEWQLYAADDTPLDNSDNPLVGTVNPSDSQGCGQLTNMFTIPAGAKEGRWILRIRNRPNSWYGYDPNRFGVWAKRSGDTNPCSIKTDSTCPNVYALEHLPVYVDASSTVATFDLAEVHDEHAEKAIVLQLFDPGEGMKSMQVLDPNGTPMQFNYQSFQTGSSGATWTTPRGNDSCSYIGPCLNVESTNYNGKKVLLEIPLPDKATWETYSDDWFQLRYRATSTVTDQTTWSASITGDPVHLIA